MLDGQEVARHIGSRAEDEACARTPPSLAARSLGSNPERSWFGTDQKSTPARHCPSLQRNQSLARIAHPQFITTVKLPICASRTKH